MFWLNAVISVLEIQLCCVFMEKGVGVVKLNSYLGPLIA